MDPRPGADLSALRTLRMQLALGHSLHVRQRVVVVKAAVRVHAVLVVAGVHVLQAGRGRAGVGVHVVLRGMQAVQDVVDLHACTVGAVGTECMAGGGGGLQHVLHY